MTTTHCFTYGSLMCEDIMHSVCAAPFRAQPATLADFSRHPVVGEEYPGMQPAPGQQVSGVLYLDLTPNALQRLDAFEGADYIRSPVRVRLVDGEMVDAWTYVYRPELAHRLGSGDWNEEAFLKHGKARFESLYMGYDALRDHAPD